MPSIKDRIAAMNSGQPPPGSSSRRSGRFSGRLSGRAKKGADSPKKLNLDAAAGAGLLPRVCALIDADPDAALDLRTALGAATLLARRGLTARHGG